MLTVQSDGRLAGRRAVLEAFGRALSRETHNLTRAPTLLWQQLFNELQWHDAELSSLLNREVERRRARGARVWVRARTRVRQAEQLRWTLKGHAGAVAACTVSPDGSYIVTAGRGDLVARQGDLVVWDGSTGQELIRLRGHEGGINACEVSSDGSFLVSAGNEGAVKVWDTSTWEDRICFSGHSGPVFDCAVSLDLSFVVSASGAETRWIGAQQVEGSGDATKALKMWHPKTGEEVHALGGDRPFAGHKGPPLACAVSPEGAFIVSGSLDELKVWDARTGEERATLSGHRGRVNDCAVSADGSLIISAGEDGILKLWDARTFEERATLEGHESEVQACAGSPDGRFVVSVGSDTSVRVWDADSGEERATLLGHNDPTVACAVSPDGGYIVSGSWDGTVRVWDAPVAARRASSGPVGPVNACAMSPDGSFVVSVGASGQAHLRSGGDQGVLKLWDARTGEGRATIRGHASSIGACAVTSDGKWVVTGGRDRLKLWDPITGAERAALRVEEGFVTACAVSPDGQFVVSASTTRTQPSASFDRPLRMWDLRTGKERAAFSGHRGIVEACAVSPDGTFLVTVNSWLQTANVWDLATGEERVTLTGLHRPSTCAVSPDGSLIAAGDLRGIIKVWTRNGQEVATRSNREGISDCAVTPDGRILVTAGREGVTASDLMSGEDVAALPLPGWARCVAVHPWLPLAAVGDTMGDFNIVELVGVDYGPIMVTALSHEDRQTIRCPACWREHLLREEWLGAELHCPTDGCALPLRVNMFVIEHAPERVTSSLLRRIRRGRR